MDPIGAPKPLLKQMETELQTLTISLTDIFDAAAALKILAPSI